MLRGCLTVLLFLAGAFSVGVAFSGDPCETEGVGGYFFVAGVLFFGAAAFLVSRALTPRAWIAWTAALTTTVGLGLGLSVLALLQWVDACAN